MDLTEAEDIKKRWQEYAEELYKKYLHDPDNHDVVISHLEPDMGPSWFPRLPPPPLLLTPRRPLEGSPLGPSSLEGLVLLPHFLSERPR